MAAVTSLPVNIKIERRKNIIDIMRTVCMIDGSWNIKNPNSQNINKPMLR
jgi:hypothetical protein